ncbi:MAG: 5-formyltetrahydrofolate cyclo-ligase [Halobacteriales archaeon]
MGKQVIRERVWDDLEASGEARFPFPPHGRIPNYAGADEAAERLTDLTAWQSADAIKCNPDAPQLPVRRAALRQGKTLYMAVPRLRDERCFLRLDPADIEDYEHATTVGGSAEVGVNVPPEQLPTIDLIVSGSVAVTEDGARIGKGEGYSDLEYAILAAFDRVDATTPVVTTVHDRQLIDDSLTIEPHDVPLDWIVTPTRTVETETPYDRPTGIEWGELSAADIEAMPVLERLQ